MKNKPLIVIPMGDPAGVGPEITVKALANKQIQNISRNVVIGDAGILRKTMTFPNMPKLNINLITDYHCENYKDDALNVLNATSLSADDYKIGSVNAVCGKASYVYIEKAIYMTLNGYADAVVTTPINKEALHLAGVSYIGHTEIFEKLTGTKDPLTIFELKDTLVFFLTRHIAFKNVSKLITSENIIDYVKRSFKVMRQFGLQNPSMAIAGLNPHCSDNGLFGNEENSEIKPAIQKLRACGYNVYGPIGADSVFFQAFGGKYDSVLSLYHDQGHIATKSVDLYRTISITGGMPILRTSVDHGTAYDIAGKGIAESISLEEAIRVATKYAPFYHKGSL